jgi:hypothetical protein
VALETYNTYDSMNRQLIVNGKSFTEYGPDGHKLAYDLGGNRISDTYIGKRLGADFMVVDNQETTETYTYDAAGRIITTVRDGVMEINRNRYDAVGNILQSGIAANFTLATTGSSGLLTEAKLNKAARDLDLAPEIHVFAYDADNRLLRDKVRGTNNTALGRDIYYGINATTLQAYDKVGNLLNYRLVQPTGSNVNYSYTYKLFESYEEASITINSGGGDSLSDYGFRRNIFRKLPNI